MRKALITGGAGFIGSHLANNLIREGYEVDLLDNFSRAVKDSNLKELLASNKVHLIDGDICESGCLEKMSENYNYIFHFAAIIGVARVLKEPYRVLNENVLMLSRMIDFARRQKELKRFIFASTSEVYAGTLEHFDLPLPTPEETPLAITGLKQPRASYMLSKIYGEAMANQSGLPVTIIRPHNFYGPRMGLAHVIPELLQKAYFSEEGQPLEVSSLNHKRTFCYISDAVEMIRRLAESEKSLGEVYNVGNENPEVTIEEVAQVVIDTVGKSVKISPRPATPGSPSRRCPKMNRTKDITGFTPSISLDEGVRRTFDWYEANVFATGGKSAQ